MIEPPLLALGGPPGSGKSTAARGVAANLRLSLHSAGDLFRQAATKQGMDLLEFSRYAETHPEVDLEVDEAMTRLAAPGRILEGRLVGEFLRRRGIPCRWVVVTAREEVRVHRIAQRDGLTEEEAATATRQREESERSRYARLYGLDLADDRADLVIDSSDVAPDAVVGRIVRFVREGELHR